MPTWLYFGVVAVGAGVALVFLLTRTKVVVEVGASDKTMRPTIGDGTSFTVDPGWLTGPASDRIVALVPPGKPSKPIVARVVAVAGDRLEIRERKLYVNGAVNKKADRLMRVDTVPKTVCPRDCVYVLVENPRQDVRDSIDFGPVPLWCVLGSINP